MTILEYAFQMPDPKNPHMILKVSYYRGQVIFEHEEAPSLQAFKIAVDHLSKVLEVSNGN